MMEYFCASSSKTLFVICSHFYPAVRTDVALLRHECYCLFIQPVVPE